MPKPVNYSYSHSRTKHEVDRTTPRGDMAISNFPNMGQMRSRSVVGRSSIYTSSYTVLIYSSYILLLYTSVCPFACDVGDL